MTRRSFEKGTMGMRSLRMRYDQGTGRVRALDGVVAIAALGAIPARIGTGSPSVAVLRSELT